MRTLQLAVLALGFTLTTLTAPVSAQDFSKVEIQTQKLSDSTYMLTGAGGNIGLSVGEDAVFVIDDNTKPSIALSKNASSASMMSSKKMLGDLPPN